MRKVGPAAGLMLLGAVLGGCGGGASSPEELVQQFLDGAKSGDYEAVLECLNTETRAQDENNKRTNPDGYRATLADHVAGLQRQYAEARISGARSDDAAPGRFIVRVTPVAAEVGLPGNVLVMDQEFVVAKENGRWVVAEIFPAALTK